MNDNEVRARIINGYLLPFEEELMKLQDIMFLRRKKTAAILLFNINTVFFLLYLIRPNTVLIAELIYAIYQMRDLIFKKISKRYFRSKIVNIKKNPEEIRYSVAEISAFIESSIFLGKEMLKYSIQIVFSFDMPKIVFIATLLAALTIIFSIIGDIITLWIFANLLFFLPLICSKLTGGRCVMRRKGTFTDKDKAKTE
jgi:hypothetical protein